VSSSYLGGILTLVRQGLTIGVQFGTHSVEALLWVAQTIEEGIYEADSLRRTDAGISFALSNPILRVGAFTTIRVSVNGAGVPAAQVRFRGDPSAPWRTAASVGPDAPWYLAPGDRTEFAIDGSFPGTALTVRLELHTPAIPPLVWFEFTETPGKGGE
jgi:hypothetical protein